MSNKILFTIGIPVLIIVAAFVLFYKPSPPTLPVSGGQANKIHVFAPPANAVVESPLVVRGEARGSWYFEASFPVKLYDGNGILLAQTPAQAQSEWMTLDFVPFEARLFFVHPTTITGMLVLEKDNPSGLPENADFISIPVHFLAR